MGWTTSDTIPTGDHWHESTRQSAETETVYEPEEVRDGVAKVRVTVLASDPSHAFLTVEGTERESVERCFDRLTPDDVADFRRAALGDGIEHRFEPIPDLLPCGCPAHIVNEPLAGGRTYGHLAGCPGVPS